MDSTNLTLNAALNISYGTFSRGKEFQDAIEKFVSNGAIKGQREANKKLQTETTKAWVKAYTELQRAGLKSQAKTFKEESKAREREIQNLNRKRKDLNKQLENTTDDGLKRRINKEKALIAYKIENELKAQKRIEATADRRSKERLKFIEDYEAKIGRTSAEALEKKSEGFQAAISTAFSADNLDLSSITENIAKGLSGVLAGQAGKIGAAGGSGTAAFAALAEAATSIALVAGPIAALAGVLAMAYSQTKDMNKEIMEASSAFDLMGGQIGGLNSRLNDLRGEVLSVATEFRLSKEEVLAASNALADSGITFNEFRSISRGAATDFEAFQDVLRSSIKSAYGLGLEVSSVAEYYNKMSRDLGYGLDQIEGSFGLIANQAQMAGMRTKDFFGAVNEAATGMALYNFRVGDTATLLTELVKILGEDLAKQKIGLEGTFKGMGMQDKYKQTLLGGSKYAGAIKADMKSQAKEFANSLAKTQGEEGLKKKGKGIVGEGGEINTKVLANMSGKAFREALETSGLTDVQKRQLQTLRGLSQAEKGGMGVAEASGFLSKRGELAAQMAQGSVMFGGKLLSELHGVQRMMAEEVTGRSGEEYDTLARIQEQMMAEFEQRKGEEGLKGKTFEEAVTEGLLQAGKKDLDKLASKKHFSEVEMAARSQLQETRSISQTVTNIIQQLLSRIALGIELLVSLFAKGDDVAKQNSESISKQEELSKSIDALDTSISEKKFALQETMDPTEKAKLQAEIEAAVAERSKAKEKLAYEEDVQRGLTRGKTREEIEKETMTKKYASLTPDKLKEAGMGGLVKKKSLSAPDEKYKEYQEIVDLTNLSEEQRNKLDEMLAVEKQKNIDDSVRADADEKLSKDQHSELVKTLQMMDKAEALAQLASYLSLTSEEVQAAMKGDQEILAKIQTELEKGGKTEAEAMLLARTGLGVTIDQEALGAAPAAHDFIYRGDGGRGKITPINSKDEFFGAKPGGAIDQSISSGGGKVQVIINGGDESRVYSVVKRVLVETGYSGMKSY